MPVVKIIIVLNTKDKDISGFLISFIFLFLNLIAGYRKWIWESYVFITYCESQRSWLQMQKLSNICWLPEHINILVLIVVWGELYCTHTTQTQTKIPHKLKDTKVNWIILSFFFLFHYSNFVFRQNICLLLLSCQLFLSPFQHVSNFNY